MVDRKIGDGIASRVVVTGRANLESVTGDAPLIEVQGDANDFLADGIAIKHLIGDPFESGPFRITDDNYVRILDDNTRRVMA